MANNRINRYIGAIVVGTVLVAVPGCTDTWDDHYNNDPASGTTLTLWDLIKDNPDFSRFADIAKHAKYYKDNTHAVSTYTYADILDGAQVNTVWVPDNSVLTEEEYKKWMDMLDENREGRDANDGYNVQQQFLGNHIALWRHNISDAKVDTVKMLNGKNLEFDMLNMELAGVPLGDADEYNIPAVNGVLHVLKGVAPFHYNFYETLKFTSPRTKFGEYVVSKDTTYFSSSASIEGLPDENGNPTYVDSVYFTSNRLFETRNYLPDEGREKCQMAEKCFFARINNEDSVFVMLMPTDKAWDDTYEKLKPDYVYAAVYEDKVKSDASDKTLYIPKQDADSLQDMSIKMDMIAPLVFNIHKQPKRGGSEMWTLDLFKEYKGNGTNPDSREDYLLNTYGDTLRSIKGEWDKASLFGDVEPTDMSNGIAYEVDSWNFPRAFYAPDVEVEVDAEGMFYNYKKYESKLGSSTQRYTFSNEAFKEVTDVYGKVSNNNFYHFVGTGPTASPKIEIKLFGNTPSAYVPNAQVMSGKYDIQLVLVPRWYVDIAKASEIDDYYLDPESEEMQYILSHNKYKFKTQISYCNGASSGKDKTTTAVTRESDGTKVDTVTVAENFEFPYSYKNMRFSYPTLILEESIKSSEASQGYLYDIVIDKIILKRKD